MKKLLFSLLLCFPVLTQAGQLSMEGSNFQHQLIMNNNAVCQAFRIHENWFATAAHCVDMCFFDGQCDIRLMLAQGPVNAYVQLDPDDIKIPKNYREVDKQGNVRTHKYWDIALLHYRPGEVLYEFPGGEEADADDFKQALKTSRSLRVQWQGAVNPKIPVLYAYDGKDIMTLKENIHVPLWDLGQWQSYSDPQSVLYFGENQSLWAADGFGVDSGNSGGAVLTDDGGVIGIATAKMNNNLPPDVRQIFPQFGQAYDFFIFNGFAPRTTLKFIQNTMGRFGNRPRVKRLRHVKPTAPQTATM